MALPPGPPLPPSAQAVLWALRPIPFMRACRRRYGPAFTVRLAGLGEHVFLGDPADIRAVFTGDHEILRAGEANTLLASVLGRRSVLMLLDGSEHLARRRLMLPPFRGRLERYAGMIAGLTEEEVARWPAGRPLELRPRMQALTMEIILRVVFGMAEPGRLDALRAQVTALLRLAASPAAMLPWVRRDLGGASPWARLQAGRARVEAMLAEEVRARRASPATAGEDPLSVLALARGEDGRPLPEDDLASELLMLVIAGHETTATALAWACERLARHPRALARLAAEAAGGGGHAYADAVARETLRVRSPLSIVARRLAAPLEMAGHDLPAGTIVAPCLFLAHRDPGRFPEPEAFRPERFLEGGAHTAAWVPFGGGTRHCLGAGFALLEMRVVLTAVARRATLAPVGARGERPRRRAIVLAPARGGRVVLGPRR
jgi:cytochrome P450 family 135